VLRDTAPPARSPTQLPGADGALRHANDDRHHHRTRRHRHTDQHTETRTADTARPRKHEHVSQPRHATSPPNHRLRHRGPPAPAAGPTRAPHQRRTATASETRRRRHTDLHTEAGSKVSRSTGSTKTCLNRDARPRPEPPTPAPRTTHPRSCGGRPCPAPRQRRTAAAIGNSSAPAHRDPHGRFAGDREHEHVVESRRVSSAPRTDPAPADHSPTSTSADPAPTPRHPDQDPGTPARTPRSARGR
jgi:hypothetical protein